MSLIYVPSKRGRKYLFYPGRKYPHAPKFAAMARTDRPSIASITSPLPPVFDQETEGSCTANADAAVYRYERSVAGLPDMVPSRNFIYWNERSMEGDTSQDDGAIGGDGITSLKTIGVCDESVWAYGQDTLFSKPSDAAFAAAAQNKILQSAKLETLDDIMEAIVQNHPVSFGITVFESLEYEEVEKTGDIPDPVAGEGCIGGHQMFIYAYDANKRLFNIQNSWGTVWGNGGRGTISFNYMQSSASDFEIITQVK